MNIIRYLVKASNLQLKAEGTSMLPMLISGDIIFFRKIDFQAIKTNDLIIVKKSHKIFTHRVIYKSNRYLITKGDNNIISDGKVYPHQIIGRVFRIKRDGQTLNPENMYLIQSSLYFAEIVKIKQSLEESKVDFVFLKGLPLHLYFEGSHPRRIYADCDVLVNYSDIIKIEKILTSMGYQKYDPSYSPIHKRLKDKPTEIQFTKNINGIIVIFDVHFEFNFLMNQLGKLDALYPQRLIDNFTGECFKTKKIIMIQNTSFSLLSSHFQIIYLALHFFHHNFRGVYRLELLDKIIRKSLPVSSPRRSTAHTSEVFLALYRKILAYQLQNFVYPVFLLLKKYYRTPLPKKFLESIKPDEKKIIYIKKNILRINIFDDEGRIEAGINRFKNLFFLSPNPFLQRIMIISNIQVIYSVFWVIIFILRRSLRRSLRSV